MARNALASYGAVWKTSRSECSRGYLNLSSDESSLCVILPLEDGDEAFARRCLALQPSPGHRQVTIWLGAVPDPQPVAGPEVTTRSSGNAHGFRRVLRAVRARCYGEEWYQCRGLKTRHFRQSAVGNMMQAGVSESEAMKISGHKTRSTCDRYDIVDTKRKKDAMKKIEAFAAGRRV